MHYFPRGMFEREGHFRRAKAQYLGEVKCIDDNVGKITAYLKNSGLWENTIVIFYNRPRRVSGGAWAYGKK